MALKRLFPDQKQNNAGPTPLSAFGVGTPTYSPNPQPVVQKFAPLTPNQQILAQGRGPIAGTTIKADKQPIIKVSSSPRLMNDIITVKPLIDTTSVSVQKPQQQPQISISRQQEQPSIGVSKQVAQPNISVTGAFRPERAEVLDALGGTLKSVALTIPEMVFTALRIGDENNMWRDSLSSLKGGVADETVKYIIEEERKGSERLRPVIAQVLGGIKEDREKIFREDIMDETPEIDSINEFIYYSVSGGSSYLMALGATLATRNPRLGAAMLTSLETAPVYNEARDAGADPDKALSVAALSGMGTYLLEKVGLQFVTERVGAKLIGNAVKNNTLKNVLNISLGAGFETGQEVIQTYWQNLVKKYGYDKSQKVFEGTWATIVGALPAAIIGGGATTLANNIAKDAWIKKVQKDAGLSEEQANQVFETFTTIAQNMREGFASAKLSMADIGRKAGQIAKEVKEDQRGQARIPGGKSTTDDLISEARKYKTTVNIQDKNDLEYLRRIFSEDVVNDIKAGKKTNWRGESYEDVARVNIISETPKTVAQQLEGKIKDIKLKNDTFYHGTSAENARGIMQTGFKRGSDLPEDAFRGGGYGQIQNSISFAETPKEASIFSTLSRNGEIVEAKLKPNARVVSIEGVEDAVDLEDYISYLKKEKVDAVYIGGGEKELVVINPKAVKPTKSQLTDIWNKANKKDSDQVAMFKADDEFQGFEDLSLTTLEKLKGRTTVSKEFIDNLTKSGDIKQAERDAIRTALESEGDKVDVKSFAEKVKAELLPLNNRKIPTDFQKYERVSLPSELRGNVKNYQERIYDSPISTSAGKVHFADADTSGKYFAHSRIEDMADNKTRRVIEVQSDLQQRGRVDEEIKKAKGSLLESLEVKINDLKAKFPDISRSDILEYIENCL